MISCFQEVPLNGLTKEFNLGAITKENLKLIGMVSDSIFLIISLGNGKDI